MSKLTEHAARQRARQTKRDDGARFTPPRWWKEPQSTKLRRDALAGRALYGYGALLPLLVLLEAAAIYLAVGRVAPSPAPEIAGGVAVVTGGVIALVLYQRIRDRLAESELQRLRGLPLAVDWKAYENELSKQRSSTRVELVVRFAESLSHEQGSKVVDAIHELLRKTSARNLNGTLTIKAPPLATHFTSENDGPGAYRNASVHAWVRQALSALLVVHAEHPLGEIEIQLEP